MSYSKVILKYLAFIIFIFIHKEIQAQSKLEVGENEEDALKREISEELNLEIDVAEKFLVVRHEYIDFNLTMHSYLCKANTEKLVLKEHIDAKWLHKNELIELDWAAADLPIVSKLINTNHELF